MQIMCCDARGGMTCQKWGHGMGTWGDFGACTSALILPRGVMSPGELAAGILHSYSWPSWHFTIEVGTTYHMCSSTSLRQSGAAPLCMHCA